jgi:hypothetical protein
MSAIQAITSVAPSIIQGAVGIAQLIKGKKMQKNLNRPDMEIPDAAKEALSVARNLASSFYMPGQSQAEQALNQQFAGTAENVMNTASSSAEALGALVNANADRMGAQTNLAGQAEQSYMNRQAMLQESLGTMADWEQDVWTQNVWNKHVENANMAASLIQSGATNAFNAVKGISGVGANTMAGAEPRTPKRKQLEQMNPIKPKGAGQLPVTKNLELEEPMYNKLMKIGSFNPNIN